MGKPTLKKRSLCGALLELTGCDDDSNNLTDALTSPYTLSSVVCRPQKGPSQLDFTP